MKGVINFLKRIFGVGAAAQITKSTAMMRFEVEWLYSRTLARPQGLIRVQAASFTQKVPDAKTQAILAVDIGDIDPLSGQKFLLNVRRELNHRGKLLLQSDGEDGKIVLLTNLHTYREIRSFMLKLDSLTTQSTT